LPTLISALRSAVRDAPQDLDHHSTSTLLFAASEGRPGSAESFLALFRALRADRTIGPLEGSIQITGGFGQSIDLPYIAWWLIKRSRDATPSRALRAVRRSIRVGTVTLTRFVAIEGLPIGTSLTLGKRLKLVPWDQLPGSPRKDSIWRQFAMAPSFHHPSSVLVRKETYEVRHVARGVRLPPSRAIDITPLDDALLILALATASAPAALAVWFESPTWTPVQITGLMIPYFEGFAVATAPQAGWASRAKRLWASFAKKSPKDRDRFRLVLQRLVSAERRRTLVDRAIDLGISLEALFLSDLEGDRAELGFRLRLRASRLLRKSATDRREVFDLLGTAYSLRSQAVHTGRVPEKVKGVHTAEILTRTLELVRESLRLLLRTGPVDWTAMTLT